MGDNTKVDYINAVIGVFKEYEEAFPNGMKVRLILSVNRAFNQD